MKNQEIYDKLIRNVSSTISNGVSELLTYELEQERKDAPIKKRRQLLFEIYPFLENMSEGHVYEILSLL